MSKSGSTSLKFNEPIKSPEFKQERAFTENSQLSIDQHRQML